jgi:hypothetical protein
MHDAGRHAGQRLADRAGLVADLAELVDLLIGDVDDGSGR